MKTWSEYVQEALVTANMGKGRIIEGFTFACGLAGEGAELKEALVGMFGYPHTPIMGSLGYDDKLKNVIKELGDFFWYCAALWQWAGFKNSDPAGCVTIDQLESLVGSAYGQTLPDFRSACLDEAGKVCELMKKHLGHGKTFDAPKWEAALKTAIITAFRLCDVVGLDPSSVLDQNIAKLRARFEGGGWDPAKSAAKADEHVDAPAAHE